MGTLDPRVRRTTQNIQCLYNLDRRIHAIKAYPTLSPQGASIFLYGHENGITIVWRGGRRLKRAPKAQSKPTPKSDSVMILDSDSDEGAASGPSASAAYVDNPEFEDAPAETSEDGFPEVQQTLDLALGTAVLHVAVLPLAPSSAKDAEPAFLREQMVFAVTCATADVYVVTLPLTPPSNESKERPQLQSTLLAGNAGRGAFGEELISLGGQAKPSNGVALTLAKQKATPATSAATTRTGAAVASSPTRVIVAAHSREASGTLRLWDVTVGAKRSVSVSALQSLDRPLEPFQTELLQKPLANVAFNPTHPTQLLATSPQDAVRIYDYAMPAIPSDYVSDGPFPTQGSWLLSLYPPFARSQTASAVRKPIVSAAWVAHGHAILVLLADGQWGIWDIDRAGSATGEPSSRSATSGVRGAALTAFSISGQIEGTSPLRNPVASTRKSAEEGLVALRGGVEVVQQCSVRGNNASSEGAVLWLGGADYIVAVIPDLARFWDAQLRGSHGGGVNLFSGSRPARMTRLTELNTSLMGERCCGVSAVPRLPLSQFNSTGEEEDVSSSTGKPPIEILIQGESRLVVVRENNDDVFTSDLSLRLLATSRKRKAGNTANTAIVVEPPSRPSGTVSFELGLNNQGSVRGAPRGPSVPRFEPRPGGKSLFQTLSRPALSAGSAATPPNGSQQTSFSEYDNGISFTQSMMVPQKPKVESGLAFAGNLDDAANATDDEEAANERNVEEEMLNLMEIDQALGAMDEHHGTDKQNVFFEGE
ncbi:hypothetical protein CMQ_5453 [Grosmannia clavigera kw1407]|uniref:Nucleoporin NUP37 n=1 Tax=Grosmannia clavigera (strain kw1407 / UAMH 11150) TaxID=655863 RepID=F0XFY9_GROCL|nr:uncharacterized protein CMQ_5453 [Grosmannia clavigera kw1407]EFX03403.1 hypothetical protein CMQ_5453 [Grosmannia clavigera kw1407]